MHRRREGFSHPGAETGKIGQKEGWAEERDCVKPGLKLQLDFLGAIKAGAEQFGGQAWGELYFRKLEQAIVAGGLNVFLLHRNPVCGIEPELNADNAFFRLGIFWDQLQQNGAAAVQQRLALDIDFEVVCELAAAFAQAEQEKGLYGGEIVAEVIFLRLVDRGLVDPANAIAVEKLLARG